MIAKILSFFNSTIDFVQKFLWIIAIVGGITSFASIKSCVNQKDQKENTIDILNSSIEKIKTKSNKKAIEAKNWQMKYQSLEQINGEIKAENSDLKNNLIEAKETIQDYQIRLKDVKNYIKTDLVSKDSIRTELVFLDCDNIEVKPIEKKHIKIDFVQVDSFLDVKYQYMASVKTVVSRYPELKDNGKKHFPNWGFIWGWDYKTTSSIDDPNAEITNLVEITFDR
jgi:hypothetical protein